ncbi:MAG: hypothetical protein M1813_008972 [Trichoglossum hirsutum]|jgi:hypothetical protein|nr:MAG: hypothetical protein M1813_008972 [Trichoglossum hirsutum]
MSCNSNINALLYLPIALGLILGTARLADGKCSVKPLVLPLKNNTLDDGVAGNRGIPVNLGGQPQGFRVTFSLDNTRVRNGRDCGSQGNVTAQSGCEGASGGVFDIDKSFEKAPDGKWDVPSIDPLPAGATVSQGYSLATFTGGLQIQDFPFEVWSDAKSSNRSGFALGRNSSVLKRFLDAAAVPSTVLGIFFGSRSQDQSVDGSLVIGGYDRSRVKGSFTNFTIAQYLPNASCPLQVQVKDVQLSGSNGSHSLFADSGGTVTMTACIDALQNQFTFTRSMYDRFASLTNHPSSPDFGPQIYPVESEPLIDTVIITLSNGYRSVIPHYEFVSRERGTDAEGKYAVVNTSRLMIAAGGDDTMLPTLGGVFLSQNYLLVDYERNMFGLAPAVTGTKGANSQDVVTLCAPSGMKSIAGPVAGGVIGGVVLLCVTAFLLFLWRRRLRIREPGFDKGLDNLPAPPVHSVELGARRSIVGGAVELPAKNYELPDKSYVEAPDHGSSPFNRPPG